MLAPVWWDLRVALCLNHDSFREICDFLVVFLPDELRSLVHHTGLKGQDDVACLFVNCAGHLLGTLTTQRDKKQRTLILLYSTAWWKGGGGGTAEKALWFNDTCQSRCSHGVRWHRGHAYSSIINPAHSELVVNTLFQTRHLGNKSGKREESKKQNKRLLKNKTKKTTYFLCIGIHHCLYLGHIIGCSRSMAKTASAHENYGSWFHSLIAFEFVLRVILSDNWMLY